MRFKKIYIEITNQCNLSCSFCIQNSRKAEFMTIENFEKILLEIKPYTRYIYLHVLGEPLLHPSLSIFLEKAYEHGFYVNLTSNATLLKKNLSILLNSKALRQINLSIHSFPDIPSYLEDVIECGEILSQHGIYISYRMWTIDEKISTTMTSALDYIQNHYHVQIHEYKNSIKLKERCYISFDHSFIWPSLNHPFYSDTGTCHGFKNMCGILVDGSVVPCCLDSKAEAYLGNIFETPFSQILNQNSKLLEELRHHHLSLELCQKCQYRRRFDK